MNTQPRRRAAIFLRVSSDEQTTANQRPALDAMITTRGLDLVRVYDETASTRRKRPMLAEMLADAHRGAFDYVLVWRLDRLGRSTMGNLATVYELDRRGVVLLSACEPFLDQPLGPLRELLIYLLGWVAQQETAALAERTRAGMERARRAGKHVGRPQATTNLHVLRDLLAGGASVREAARQLGLSPSTLRGILARAERGRSESTPQAPEIVSRPDPGE